MCPVRWLGQRYVRQRQRARNFERDDDDDDDDDEEEEEDDDEEEEEEKKAASAAAAAAERKEVDTAESDQKAHELLAGEMKTSP